jgi:hypothetical protein
MSGENMSEIKKEVLRIYNTTMRIYNVMKDNGPSAAESEFKRLPESDLQQIYTLLALMETHGRTKIQADFSKYFNNEGQ